MFWYVLLTPLAIALGVWIGLRFGDWHIRRAAERRTHKELLRRERERRERELLEAHIAEHEKMWKEQRK